MSSFKMEMSQETIDLSLLVKDADAVGDKVLRKCATVIKANAVKRLTNIKTAETKDVHMCSDVTIKSGKDKYGYPYCKVGGGKKTGTKWHLVNDGTYRSKATHFMDNAIKDSEVEVVKIIDEEFKRVFK